MRHILVVDDEKNVLKTLSIGLRRHDYVVKQAQNGCDALKILAKGHCDYVVSDIRMYPMDGYTLAAKIQSLYPDTGIVLMSAYGHEDHAPPSRQMSTIPRLTKPFSVSELIDLIEKKPNAKTSPRHKERTEYNILYLGNTDTACESKAILNNSSFRIHFMEPSQHIEEHIRNIPFELILIDDDLLDDHDWRLLNTLDKHIPHKPIVLLSCPDPKSSFPHSRDLNVSMADKNRFLSDHDYREHIINKHISNE